MSLTGKSAVVTGGNGGIGLEICKAFLNENLKNLAILDLKGEECVIKLKNDFPKANIFFKETNLIDKESVDRVYEEIKRNFQQIHIVVNSVGVADEQNVFKTINVNVCGVMYSTLAARSQMTKENNGEGGIIINIASVFGLDPTFSHPIYSASKCAVIGFTRALGNDCFYDTTGIKFITLCPGATSTSMLEECIDMCLFPGFSFDMSTIRIQDPSEVGKCVMEILRNGENCSVWISDDCDFREIEIRNIV